MEIYIENLNVENLYADSDESKDIEEDYDYMIEDPEVEIDLAMDEAAETLLLLIIGEEKFNELDPEEIAFAKMTIILLANEIGKKLAK